MFLLPWQPPQEWEVRMVPRQLAGLQEQFLVALRNVTTILGVCVCVLTSKRASGNNDLHWDTESTG